MRKRLVRVLLFVCLLGTHAHADSFRSRYYFPYVDEPTRTSTAPVSREPVTSVEDALAIARVLLTLVAHLDKRANRDFEDLRAHLHTGGSWDSVLLWDLAAKRWPAITAIETDQDAEPRPVRTTSGADSRARLATQTARRIDPSWVAQEQYGMLHIPYQLELRR